MTDYRRAYASGATWFLKRDGVCNPVTHVLKAIEAFKRFRPKRRDVLYQRSLSNFYGDQRMTKVLTAELPDQFLSFFPTPIADCFFIDGDNDKDKETFLNEFSEKLKFPEYFGFNWDAFSDSVTDLSWLNSENGFLIIYKNSHNFRSNRPNEWRIANEILLEAMDYWKEQGKPMIIILL